MYILCVSVFVYVYIVCVCVYRGMGVWGYVCRDGGENVCSAAEPAVLMFQKT